MTYWSKSMKNMISLCFKLYSSIASKPINIRRGITGSKLYLKSRIADSFLRPIKKYLYQYQFVLVRDFTILFLVLISKESVI